MNSSDQIKFEKAENYGKIKSDTLINNCIDTYNKIKANPSDFYAVKESSGSDQQTMNGDNSQQPFENNWPDNDQSAICDNSNNDDTSHKQFFCLTDNSPLDFPLNHILNFSETDNLQ